MAAGGAGLLLGWIIIVNIHPFLAVTRRVPARVLVVEGWTHYFGVGGALNEFKTGHYDRLLTTGGPCEGFGPKSSIYDTEAWQSARLLKQAGLPEAAVQAVPSVFVGRNRTYNSALALRDWLLEHEGGTGHWPVPLGHRPNGTTGTSTTEEAVRRSSGTLPVPSGGSPLGTAGGSGVVRTARSITEVPSVPSGQWPNGTGRLPVPPFSLNVMTEDAHARRTWLLFREALGPDVQVGIISVPNPDYDAAHWWRSSEGVREVIDETVAYVYAKFLFWPEAG